MATRPTTFQVFRPCSCNSLARQTPPPFSTPVHCLLPAPSPQALLEAIGSLLLSGVFDPIWMHRDLLARPRVGAGGGLGLAPWHLAPQQNACRWRLRVPLQHAA